MAKFHFANTRDSDMFYAAGVSISDPFFLIERDGKKTVFLNALELEAFRERNSGIEALPIELFRKEIKGTDNALGKIALAILEQFDLIRAAIDVSRCFPLDVADYLRSRGVVLNVITPFMPGRSRKSKQEIEYIRSALKATARAFELIENILKDSKIAGDSLVYGGEILTSEFLKKKVGTFLYENGMDDTEGMIISSGRQASMPHHKGSGPILPNSPIVCDLFPRSRESGHFADMTRSYVKGKSAKKLPEMYDALRRAQDAAFKSIEPGVHAKDIYSAAANEITKAGFDVGEKGFIHSLGHGLGLDVHEPPSIGPDSEDVLEIGNVITIEPGLYYPEYGGIRLEDVAVVNEDGFENLTNYPRDFVIS